MEQLHSEQIHLWLAWLGEITDSRLLTEYRSLLSDEELDKQARFYFERDRHRYLVTRAMVRTVLSKYADVEPRYWSFAGNAYGRPSIAAKHKGAEGLEFNISHTDGLVVLCVACERLIGVDVENVRTREIDVAIADRYFAPAEVAALRALPPEQQRQRFFEFWTLKEAYIKARGVGLSIPLNRFAFQFDDADGISFTIYPGLGDCEQRWVFRQLCVGHDHLVAVCAEKAGPPSRLLLHRFSSVPRLEVCPMPELNWSHGSEAR